MNTLLIRRTFQAFIICCAHQAVAQYPAGAYQTQTFNPNYSVTTGPNGYTAETQTFSNGYSTTTVSPGYFSRQDLYNRACSGVSGCGGD